MERNQYINLPQEIKKIVDSWDDNKDRYKECERIKKELEAKNYTCDYGLDGTIYDLRTKKAPKHKDLKVRSVRYFETRRGTGYECATNKLNVVIWNDGQGGGTYIANYYPYTKDYSDIMENEQYLESLIDDFENVVEDVEKIPFNV